MIETLTKANFIKISLSGDKDTMQCLVCKVTELIPFSEQTDGIARVNKVYNKNEKKKIILRFYEKHLYCLTGQQRKKK